MRRVANFLNEGTATHRIPPEILERILYLSVDHGSEEHAGQLIALTRVCRYWRTLLLSYPRMWSTLYMKPGNPSAISEWLTRSQDVPLTVIANFTDTYEHPPCRYEDSATAVHADTYDLEVCRRHEAVLSLDQLFPHRSRIRDLDILLRLSNPGWDDDDRHDNGEPILLNHPFFMETLPNLERLDFRATHVEGTRCLIPIPDHLFAGQLPRIRELKYLGVSGGLVEVVKGLESCEIGPRSRSVGPAIISPAELQILFSNNTSVKSLVINNCEFYTPARQGSTATPMTDLEFLRIYWLLGRDLEIILNLIRIPQFQSLDTARLSFNFPRIRVVATDGSNCTFEFSQSIGEGPDFYPLRHLGAAITALRLGQGMTLRDLDGRPELFEFFRSLDAVQVLEFDGAAGFVRNILSGILFITGVFLGLKVIRVAISRDDCEGALRFLAAASRRRMEEGNPLATIEPLVGVEDGLGQDICAELEKHYKAKGIQNFLSE